MYIILLIFGTYRENHSYSHGYEHQVAVIAKNFVSYEAVFLLIMDGAIKRRDHQAAVTGKVVYPYGLRVYSV